MRTSCLTAAVAAASMLAAGCLETKQDVTLNPDCSGKARVEIVMSDMPLAMDPNQEPPDPDVTAKQFVKSVLDGSKGIETWADVSYERTEDNRTRFIGTAYFKNFTEMQLSAGKMEGVTLAKTDDGGMVLRLKPQGQPGPGPTGGPTTEPEPPQPPMSDEQIQQRLAAERAKWQQMKPMMAMTIGKMKMEATFRLPGTLTEVKGFQKTKDGGARFLFDGAKVLEVIDKLMTDDAYVRENMLKGKGGMGQPPLDEKALTELFGTAGPLVAKASAPLNAQFDYAAEVQAAKAAYPGMIKRLGLDQVPAQVPGPQLPPGFPVPGAM